MRTIKFPTGFSLIELMVVVAIIAILAVAAVPQYQNYAVRARLAEAVQMLATARVNIAEYAITQGKMPDTAAAGLDTIETDLVELLKYEVRNNAGTLSIKVRNTGNVDVDGKYFSMVGKSMPKVQLGGADVDDRTGVRAQGVINWHCRPGDADGQDAIPEAFLPPNCRTVAAK